MKSKRMGKGERIVYDERMEPTIEALCDKLDYCPSLRQIAEYINDGSTAQTVDRSIRRLIANGRLSDDARKVYGGKNNDKTKCSKKDNKKRGGKKV